MKTIRLPRRLLGYLSTGFLLLAAITVRADSCRLAPLSEVEQHIKAEKHLPGIPSAAEVAAGGVSLGDMQARLLAKVEELTLHVIAQEKRNDAQQGEIAALRAQLARLSTQN